MSVKLIINVSEKLISRKHQSSLIDDSLLHHKGGTPWNYPKIIEFGYLIKYCSLRKHIHLPSTLDLHFVK